MRSTNPAVLAILDTGQWELVECYDIQLAGSSTVLRYTSGDSPITFPGPVTYNTGFVLQRGNVTQRLGLDEQTCDITMAPFADAATPPLINGRTLQQTLQLGLFNQANVTIWEAFLASYSDTSPGLVHLFGGRVSAIKAGRLKSVITVTSGIALLDIDMPRNIVQTGCTHCLFDAGCGLARATFLKSGTFTGTPGVTSFHTSLFMPNGYFNLGIIDCTSGVNAGLSRTIASSANAGGVITLFQPWPSPPKSGDTFNASPGCNKTQAQCGNANPLAGPAYNNINRFGGDPYVPAVETLYDGGAIAPPAAAPGKQGTPITGTPFGSNTGTKNIYGP